MRKKKKKGPLSPAYPARRWDRSRTDLPGTVLPVGRDHVVKNGLPLDLDPDVGMFDPNGFMEGNRTLDGYFVTPREDVTLNGNGKQGHLPVKALPIGDRELIAL